jgi:hypothetical protein
MPLNFIMSAARDLLFSIHIRILHLRIRMSNVSESTLRDAPHTHVIQCSESYGKIQTGVRHGPPYGTDTRYPDRSQGDVDRIRHTILKETP